LAAELGIPLFPSILSDAAEHTVKEAPKSKEKGKSVIPQTPLFSIILLTSHLDSLAYGSSTTTIAATPSHALSGLSGSTSATAADDTLTAELEAVMSLSTLSGVPLNLYLT